ncbi:MAG: ribosome assembly factor SBDS [Candidatus Parvarchaeota archaeon]|nr:ribosome assembly factor SBDS [Candidatus Parvarchaeota archaeon]
MDDRVIARLQIKDKKFEIFVDCEKAMLIKESKSSDIDSALLVDNVFKDVRRGEVAGDLPRYFGTEDTKKIALEIIKRGDVQLSAAYREKQNEMLKKRIIDNIASMAIDSTTNLPIPRKRIELAMQDIHHNFDFGKSEKDQTEEILSKLKKVLPIKLGEFEYSAEAPIQYANDILMYLKRLADIKNTIRTDSSMNVDFSVKAGNEGELLSRLKSVTHGNITIRRI